MNKKLIFMVIASFLVLILSACLAAPSILALGLPDGTSRSLANGNSYSLGKFADGTLDLICAASEDQTIQLVPQWHRVFSTDSYQIFLTGHPGEDAFEAILRAKDGTELGRTRFNQNTGYDYSTTKWTVPSGETEETLKKFMLETAAIWGFDNYVDDAGKQWAGVKTGYSCSLPK